MERYAIVLAGGEGHRAGSGMPKQFRQLGGEMMIRYSLRAFRSASPDVHILLVLHPGYFDDWDIETANWPESELADVTLVCGGRSRFESVYNALMEVPDSDTVLVAVHDSARPLVTPDMIRRGWEKGAERGTAVPVVPLTDSIRRVNADMTESHAEDRSNFRCVQTPQVFRASLLKRAYELGVGHEGFTDDASVVESAGHSVSLYDGEVTNIKVTHPADFAIAEAILNYAEE